MSFQQTLDIVLASAMARDDLLKSRSERREESGGVFCFRLLAASDAAQPALPAAGWYDLSRLVQMSISAVGAELHLRVQAQGYAALLQVRTRPARLISANGLLDHSFGFDAQGAGVLVLANTIAVHQSLGDCRVLIGASPAC